MSREGFFFLRTRRGEHLVVLQFVLFFVFVLTPVWSPPPLAGLLAQTEVMRWGALVLCFLVAAGFGGFGVLHIRNYLTPLPYPVDHSRLVTNGVYALVRHPLYSSQLFAALGWSLFNLSLSHAGVLVLGFIFFDYKASREEAWLRQRHPEYAEYARAVRKFIPGVY